MAGERPCTFCDRSQFEEQLVAESENFYVIATLGQITDGGYVLLVPKRHVLCVGDMTMEEIIHMTAEASKLDQSVSEAYRCSTTIFEHGIVGQSIKHAHLHIIPAACIMTERIRSDFSGKEMNIIHSLSDLNLLYRQKLVSYLFWNDYNLRSTVCWDPPAPPQYLRKVVAEYIGKPERANWREMDPVLDKQFWSETVARLKKYF